MKNNFEDVLLSLEVKRKGMEKLVDYLANETDFFTAPASTRFHGAKEGGLLEHSEAVMKQMMKLAKLYIPDCQEKADSLIIVSALHDVCKTNFYRMVLKWRKDENNQWEQYPSWEIDDQAPLGHGEKSARIVSKYVDLTDEEWSAIRWHMGAWGTEDYSGRQALNQAMEKYPLVLLLQMADQAAAYLDKK